jgi:hypothetical protein
MVAVEEEIVKLIEEMKRLGSPSTDGKGILTVKFGILVLVFIFFYTNSLFEYVHRRDDRIANILEGLVGTLKAAKKRKIIFFDAELLLQGVHDNVDVVLLKDKL